MITYPCWDVAPVVYTEAISVKLDHSSGADYTLSFVNHLTWELTCFRSKYPHESKNKSVVYTVQYSCGEIKLSDHHEISFINILMTVTKRKQYIIISVFVSSIKLLSTCNWIVLKCILIICQCISVGWNAKVDWFPLYTYTFCMWMI